MIELIVAAAVATAPPSPIPNFHLQGNRWVIGADRGGVFSGYKKAFESIEGTGLEVRVTDYCGTACTLVLANPRVCAENSARVGFHQAYDINTETRVFLGRTPRLPRSCGIAIPRRSGQG